MDGHRDAVRSGALGNDAQRNRLRGRAYWSINRNDDIGATVWAQAVCNPSLVIEECSARPRRLAAQGPRRQSELS